MSDSAAPFPYDFYHFWAAGVVARAGGDPYLVSAIHPVMVSVGWRAEEATFGFLHPFWSLWIFSAISTIPFAAAKWVWEGLVLLLVSVSLLLITRPSVRKLLALQTPIISTLHNGQTNPFMLLGLVTWLTLALKQRDLLAGVALSLTAIKPQLFIPFYVWVFLSNFRSRGCRYTLGFAIGLVLQIGISLIIAPNSALYWAESMQQVSNSAMNLPTPALGRIIAGVVGSDQIPLLLNLLAICAAVWSALNVKHESLAPAILVWLPLSSLVAPYTWTHGFLVLLPLYLALLSTFESKRPKLITYGIAALAIVALAEMHHPHTFAGYMVVLPLILLVFGLKQTKAMTARLASAFSQVSAHR
jgi:hypothetical protein